MPGSAQDTVKYNHKGWQAARGSIFEELCKNGKNIFWADVKEIWFALKWQKNLNFKRSQQDNSNHIPSSCLGVKFNEYFISGLLSVPFLNLIYIYKWIGESACFFAPIERAWTRYKTKALVKEIALEISGWKVWKINLKLPLILR